MSNDIKCHPFQAAYEGKPPWDRGIGGEQRVERLGDLQHSRLGGDLSAMAASLELPEQPGNGPDQHLYGEDNRQVPRMSSNLGVNAATQNILHQAPGKLK
ncbi:MAG: hypothetical protein KJZ78_19435 [Bryobacteraceae bacterium]|nr:hypothetical protein [Bryobacteraceae bacterium]